MAFFYIRNSEFYNKIYFFFYIIHQIIKYISLTEFDLKAQNNKLNCEILRKKNTTLAYSEKTLNIFRFFLMILIFCVRKNDM